MSIAFFIKCFNYYLHRTILIDALDIEITDITVCLALVHTSCAALGSHILEIQEIESISPGTIYEFLRNIVLLIELLA